MENQPFILERILDAPFEKVWKAITDRDEMENWYFKLKDFKAEVGFTFQFTGGPSPEKQFVHICEVTEVIPNQKLTYSWKYEGYSGISYVSFELFPQGDKTLLKLTHSGLESFPENVIEFAKHNFIEGWNEIINTSLVNYLA